jgi:hypothetical protein
MSKALSLHNLLSVAARFALSLLLFFMWVWQHTVSAQCSMCKAAAATTDDKGELMIGAGINTGVLYLLAIPFLAVGLIGFLWYRQKRMRNQEPEVEE